MRGYVLFAFLALVLPLLALGSAQEPTKKDQDPAKTKNAAGSLMVINGTGKEMAFDQWQIVQGTRKVAGEPEPVKPVDKEEKPIVKWPAGKEHLEFREDNSTNYKEGILTLVPMTSLRKADYDETKKTVAATLVAADGKELVLAGTTKYNDINKLTIDVTADFPDLGPTSLRFKGGVFNATPLVRSFRFPSKQSAPKASGPNAVVVGVDKEKTVHKVQDLKALYRTGSVDRISPFLIFKKDAKIEVSKIVKFRNAPPENKKQASVESEVTLADGRQLNLILIRDVFPDNGLPATFLGFIGKVPAGYKLFPLHTLAEMRKEE